MDKFTFLGLGYGDDLPIILYLVFLKINIPKIG